MPSETASGSPMIESRPVPISSAIILPIGRRTRKAHASHWPIGGSMSVPSMTAFVKDFRRKDCWRKLRVTIKMGRTIIVIKETTRLSIRPSTANVHLPLAIASSSWKTTVILASRMECWGRWKPSSRTHYICGSTDLRADKTTPAFSLYRSKITNPLITATPPQSTRPKVPPSTALSSWHRPPWTGI